MIVTLLLLFSEQNHGAGMPNRLQGFWVLFA